MAQEYPECTISLSSEVLPEYREYERTVTTLVDVFVKPHMERYLRRVDEALGAGLRERPFLVMQSSGGVASADQVVRKPITTALSGPAAGAIGSAVIARIAGFENVVTLDAGGTSTDLCLIERGEPHLTNSGSVGPFPVRIPMIDIETIGTGGGSIAWISREGDLKVGPRSAGAEPGPMCYPNGGNEPTITDANLVLGRIPPSLIGGGIPLDVARSRAGLAALAERLAHPEGRPARPKLSVEALANGIIEIANWSQANRIRQMTIQRGIDPRDFALLSFGGAGPAQSAAVMDLIGMTACIVPPNPGNLSAFGLLAVDWRTDHIITKVMAQDAADATAVAGLYAQLEQEASDTLRRDGIDPARIRLLRQADVRYVGQSMEVRVEAPAGAVDATFLDRVADAFHAAHRQTFGYDYAGQQKVEFVNFCVSGFGLIERPQLPKLDAVGGPPKPSGDARRLFRWRVRRHADLSAPRARARCPHRRAGGDRGVRVDHGGVPAPAARGRSPRHPDLARGKAAGGEAMNIQAAPGGAKPWPTPPQRAAVAVDPIVLQIVEGTLNSIEAEIEYAIERTARSPMIREAHDYRVGLFDRYCRKLTGRSYSAMPNARGARLPARHHEAGRHLPDERHLSHRGQHRPFAGPLQHGAGVSRRRGGRLHPGIRPPR